jgi:RNA polymerase sigma factor (sigma-70 family)
VLAALQELPPRQRQVMAWIIDGFGATEIARELGVSPESVRQSYAKARKNLGRFYGRRKKR